MPFGSLNTSFRLGVANVRIHDVFRWARQILRLPSDTFNPYFPIYQGSIAHNLNWEDGGNHSAAEMCSTVPADSEHSLSNVLRQVSAHESNFSCRNISDNSPPGTNPYPIPNETYSLDQHSITRYGQVYYVNNEPEAFSLVEAMSYDPCLASNNLKGPRDLNIDVFIPLSSGNFWDSQINQTGGIERRITSSALAYIYLKLKTYIESMNGRQHVVLLPSPIDPTLGQADLPASSCRANNTSYWTDFYDKIHTTGVILNPPSGPAVKVTPQQARTLHLHYYSAPRGMPELPTNYPIEAVAEGAYKIKKGVKWYRDRYNGGNPLDMDIMLSEFGYLWQIEQDGRPKHEWQWAGGWKNFQSGLSWWNSWLCWLMRRAPIQSECNLLNSPNGTRTDAHALYGCIHHAMWPPYTTSDTSSSGNWAIVNGIRSQPFFNSDAWSIGYAYSQDFINVQQLDNWGRFQRSFTAFTPTSWDGVDAIPNTSTNWRIGPFGACYKVWAQVGADPSSSVLGGGWITNTQAGIVGEVSIDLPVGYSTVYFPIIKGMGTFNPGTRFDVIWKNGNQQFTFGYGDMGEFPDSKLVQTIYDVPVYGSACVVTGITSRDITPAQNIYSSMVFPVLCFSTIARTVTAKIQVTRIAANEPGIGFGRPVVLNQACTWLSNQ